MADAQASVKLHLSLEVDLRVVAEFTQQQELNSWLQDKANVELVATTFVGRIERLAGGREYDEVGWVDENRPVLLADLQDTDMTWSEGSIP